MPKALVNVNKLVIVTENHGGYLGGECLSCGALGWLDGKLGYSHTVEHEMVSANRLQHKASCPVSPHALKKFIRD